SPVPYCIIACSLVYHRLFPTVSSPVPYGIIACSLMYHRLFPDVSSDDTGCIRGLNAGAHYTKL
ncbi:hypothetical protein ACYULU_16480, partial [Breznakiellaceae bacterium SP9]